MELITFSYNIKQDIKRMYGVFFKRFWFIKSKNIFFIYPTPFRLFKIIFFPPKPPVIDIKENIKCYWVSGGTRGGYYPSSIIHVCPFERFSNKYINAKEMERVIRHEITHLKYWSETKDMTFEDRERFVNAKAKEDIWD